MANQVLVNDKYNRFAYTCGLTEPLVGNQVLINSEKNRRVLQPHTHGLMKPQVGFQLLVENQNNRFVHQTFNCGLTELSVGSQNLKTEHSSLHHPFTPMQIFYEKITLRYIPESSELFNLFSEIIFFGTGYLFKASTHLRYC